MNNGQIYWKNESVRITYNLKNYIYKLHRFKENSDQVFSEDYSELKSYFQPDAKGA